MMMHFTNWFFLCFTISYKRYLARKYYYLNKNPKGEMKDEVHKTYPGMCRCNSSSAYFCYDCNGSRKHRQDATADGYKVVVVIEETDIYKEIKELYPIIAQAILDVNEGTDIMKDFVEQQKKKH